ncbi:hypothetical protein [Streptomyces sp. DW26H14]|uniref:hypothetical protein n=1 Tax=Streptomyces sp. DW26H14 TaxID=3435395 RepID=UPI00403D90DC
MTEPRAVITEALAAAEPALPQEVLESAVDQVANTLAKLRRLAQALDDAPDLLTSGRPEGPRLVELLIRALQPHGTTHLVLPRCARCDNQRSLTRTDGLRRLCAYCGGIRNTRREPCTVCGKTRAVAARDRDGRPRCFRHQPRESDDIDVICDLLRSRGIGLDDQVLTEVVGQALPQLSQRRQVAGELTRRPDLLAGQGAYGSTRVIALVEALVAHGAHGVTLPSCPFCHRTVPLRFRRDDTRCCRRCYDTARRQICSRCGRDQPVATRTADRQPICRGCMRIDPIYHETCRGCDRLAYAVHHDDKGNALCKRCWRPPLATCSVCGDHKPCHFADTDAPRCPNCTDRLTQLPCSRCGTTTTVYGRTADGEPLCCRCGRRREPCVTCGNSRYVTSRTPDGQALCGRCFRKSPLSFRDCVECGVIGPLHHFGLCERCAAPRQLRAFLTGPDGIMRPELEPVVTALAASTPSSLLIWLRHDRPRQLLSELAEGTGPVTHQALDQLPQSKSLRHLRAALVSTGVLPERDELLIRFEQWISRVLEEVEDPAERKVMKSFTTWFYLRRLRIRSARRRLLSSVHYNWLRYEVRSAVRLLAWLRSHGTTLATCTQSDIDQWLSSRQPGRHAVRNFLVWAVDHGHARNVTAPTHTSSRGQTMLPEVDQRWDLSRRLLHDTTLATVDRVAGCLVLLYGQTCTRIAALTTSHVTKTDQGVQLMLGTRPLDTPEPLASLILELVRTRQGYAVVGHTDSNPWLFPGGRPGRPMDGVTLMARLNRLGIPTRAGRNTALMELAGELPAVVLSRLLGIHLNTATLWSQEAGNTRPGYAAEVARRAPRSDPA